MAFRVHHHAVPALHEGGVLTPIARLSRHTRLSDTALTRKVRAGRPATPWRDGETHAR